MFLNPLKNLTCLPRTYRMRHKQVALDLLSPHLLGACETVISTMSEPPATTSEEYVPGTHSMAFVTVPSMDVAKKLSHGIVQGKLAACVNIIPQVVSVYEWEGKVNEDPELIMMIKTRTSKVDDLSKYIKENHPYDVAEVISSKIDNGNPPYLKWLGDAVMD